MFSINGTTISLTRGDTFEADVTILSDGKPYTPVEGDVITFAMKKEYTDAEPLIEKAIPHATMVLQLDPSDTADLSFGHYVYDIDIVFSNGNKDTFISEGDLVLTPEV